MDGLVIRNAAVLRTLKSVETDTTKAMLLDVNITIFFDVYY